MASSPQLSIIIPTLNEEREIENQLASLLGLWVCGVEVLVVDGGSQDRTAALASPFVSRVIVCDPGRARQMNVGAHASQGDHLLFLHADTRLPKRADLLIAKALARRPWGRFDVQLSGRHAMLGVIARAMNLRSWLTGIATGDQALFMTRAAFTAAGGFPEQPLMEDVEMTSRLKRLSRPTCVPQRVASSGRRWERHGLWSTMVLMWRLRYRYWQGVDSRRLVKAYRHVR
ncbi:TIGR04283 family arsenosugar biosynthesis glycosyltransferase [Halomonas sp. M20]|uniref:TIGR04283 family arsenosugar biosynthesis glycosyltransferase n=1 Tax=Halomonas sp. M20 TaxID=2763264 RepID=UPI001D0A2088|nr:TIGR04283 family arsenosugar biosynthesis glycosyltransferase [Halomonas sp. M20]